MYTVYSNQLKIITYKYMYMYILDIYCIYTCTYTNQTILKTADKRVMMKLSKGLVCYQLYSIHTLS